MSRVRALLAPPSNPYGGAALVWAGIALVALLQWLAGDAGATVVGELYLVIAVGAGLTHAPRRVLAVLAAIAVALAAPLVYGERSADLVAQAATRLLLWSAVALVASRLVRTLRAQRAALREATDRAEELARRDQVTALPNRRAFDEALPTEISRARRLAAPLCLVVADINRFRAINDDHGRAAGDECLRAAAEALRDEMRQYDTCFRWGADEFALLLPQTTRTEADAACERLADAVARRCRRPDGTALGTACAAAQLADGMTGEDFIRAGDAALLALKGAHPPRLRAV